MADNTDNIKTTKIDIGTINYENRRVKKVIPDCESVKPIVGSMSSPNVFAEHVAKNTQQETLKSDGYVDPWKEDESKEKDIENSKNNVDTDTGNVENEEENDIILGECRKHPPHQVPLLSKDGKALMMINTMGGHKPVNVYEYPMCVGDECSSGWCNIHGVCIDLCKYEHGYDEEENNG